MNVQLVNMNVCKLALYLIFIATLLHSSATFRSFSALIWLNHFYSKNKSLSEFNLQKNSYQIYISVRRKRIQITVIFHLLSFYSGYPALRIIINSYYLQPTDEKFILNKGKFLLICTSSPKVSLSINKLMMLLRVEWVLLSKITATWTVYRMCLLIGTSASMRDRADIPQCSDVSESIRIYGTRNMF